VNRKNLLHSLGLNEHATVNEDVKSQVLFEDQTLVSDFHGAL
jgi:hypothetical protein